MKRLNKYIRPLKRPCEYCNGTNSIIFGPYKVECGAKNCVDGYVFKNSQTTDSHQNDHNAQ